MMQRRRILDLLQAHVIVTIKQLERELKVSSRTVRGLLSELRRDGKYHGFRINTVRNTGYTFELLDAHKFEEYKAKRIDDLGGVQARIPRILYFILQQNDYISVQKIADLIGVSRNTVKRDLIRLEVYLKQRNLELDFQPGHGVCVRGEEQDLRSIFSHYVVNSKGYTSITQEYFDFKESLNMSELARVLKDDMLLHNLLVSKMSFDSIVDHIRVLIFRAKQGNYISEMEWGPETIDGIYSEIAGNVIRWIETTFGMRFPSVEIEYLASQIAGKSSVENVPELTRVRIKKEIQQILQSIDTEFLTNFSADTGLVDALLMHMYPLLTRIAHRIELNNPLIEFVSSRYANVFLVALRFVELWEDTKDTDFSRDEVGYLALHFAAYFERKRNEAINSFTRILLISSMGRGNALLTKHKLMGVFRDAFISIDQNADTNSINASGADLVLSSIPLQDLAISAPVIYIREMIDDHDISDIKDLLVLRTHAPQHKSNRKLNYELFDENLFELSTSNSYLEAIGILAQKMVKLGYASMKFPDLVYKRELKFSTIYGNGVAGPHSMELNAIIEKVGIIIPQTAMHHEKTKVNIIFLINIRKGDLFLYRMVSKLMQSLIQDERLETKLKTIKNFNDFIRFIDQKQSKDGNHYE